MSRQTYRAAQRLLAVKPSPLQEMDWPAASAAGVRLYVKRDDLLDPRISGNKWRKLLPQVAWHVRQGSSGFVSVGGLHSNHLAALAALGQRLNVPTLGYVRGGIPQQLSPTLAFAKTCGMQLQSATRTQVRAWRVARPAAEYLEGLCWLPEGGSTRLGLLGAKTCFREIEQALGAAPAALVVAAGSGGTGAGMARATSTRVFACDVVGDRDLPRRMATLLGQDSLPKNLEVVNAALSGFASGEPAVYQAMLECKARNGFLLDPIYTAKALLKLDELLWRGDFAEGDHVVLVHTGGLQGVAAWGNRYGYELDTLAL